MLSTGIRRADDYPYGGGAGMVMKPEPLAACIEAARVDRPRGQGDSDHTSGETLFAFLGRRTGDESRNS